MATVRSRRKDIIEAITGEGVEIITPTIAGARTAHVKIECRYKGVDFFLVTSLTERGGKETWFENFRGDVRRAKRAIDDNEPTLLQRLGRHR